ncbi:hypothetical protein [Clostridium ihumii]|uniref:hypothetical protein n=1 Tax=Clostridium ihumii TaxID=1470356 RepID=UPI000A9229D5|nr:hypothetical protein [Clostridium ihumii]
MKIVESEIKSSLGWRYRELKIKLEEKVDQLNFIKECGTKKSSKSHTIQRFERTTENN